MTEHWIDKAKREGRGLNLATHKNQPRISAEVIVRLIEWKNKLLGTKRSIYEESLIAEEKNEQYF